MAAAGVCIGVAGCGDADDPGVDAAEADTESAETTVDTAPGGESADDRYPDVVEVTVTAGDDGTYTVATTMSSPYDSPERYADAWRVLDAEGAELGVRELAHDHAGEQPFTRSLDLTIPDGVAEITVEGRDLANGYGGETVTVPVPER